jgi:hypothetical protein
MVAGERLANECDLALVLFHTCDLQTDQPVLPAVMTLPVAATIFTGVAVAQSQLVGAGPSPVTRHYSLHWDILTAIYGGEDRIATIAERLRDTDLPETNPEIQQALDLVDRYLGGWRPPDPFADLETED